MEIVLGIGSNCGDRERNVREALSWLCSFLQDPVFSDIYETPCAKKESSPYMNAVLKAENINLALTDLETLIKQYELSQGRNNECREHGRVPIDVDIVMAGDRILKEWDYRQKFFQKGYQQVCSIFRSPVVKENAY